MQLFCIRCLVSRRKKIRDKRFHFISFVQLVFVLFFFFLVIVVVVSIDIIVVVVDDVSCVVVAVFYYILKLKV